MKGGPVDAALVALERRKLEGASGPAKQLLLRQPQRRCCRRLVLRRPRGRTPGEGEEEVSTRGDIPLFSKMDRREEERYKGEKRREEEISLSQYERGRES